jgi:hypothetical protein
MVYTHVLVITRARVPHGRYWHSSDVKHEGRRPAGGLYGATCQYLLCGTREGRVITNLLHEQLAKGLFLCCVPQKDTRLLGKGYRAASLLGCALKRTPGSSISKLTWTYQEVRGHSEFFTQSHAFWSMEICMAMDYTALYLKYS